MLHELINKYNIKTFITDPLQLLKTHNSDEPFYVIDIAEIERTVHRWNAALPNVKAYYAMKCNPNPIIVETLHKLDCNFDCASKTELEHILKLTNDASRIIFAHPCKYPSHIKYAQENDVNLMTFDCAEELIKIKKYHPNCKLLLRLAVDDSQSLCQFNKKFGCKKDNIANIMKVIKDLDLNLVGFSFHVGSGCKSADTYYDALKTCSEAMFIANSFNFKINIIDLGGGFMAHTEEGYATFEHIAEKIKQGQEDFFQTVDIEFIAEPGRFMVQTSHTLIVSIVAKKKLNDKFVYYINDGVYGSFNCIIFDHQHPKLIPVVDIDDNTLYETQIFGNTCDSLDEIKQCVLLPELNIGDYLYVENFGAYTTSAKSDRFNGYIVDNFKYIYNMK
jgi:ornithine decarboxylase